MSMSVESSDRREERPEELSSDSESPPFPFLGHGLLDALDVIPYTNSWRGDESPRGGYGHGLLAALDGDPFYRHGYGISGGYGHEMADMPGYADGSHGCGFESGTHTGSSHDLEPLVAWFNNGDPENEENTQSNGEIDIFMTTAGIDISREKKTNAVKINVFRWEVGTDFAGEAARYLFLSEKTNGSACPTTNDSPSDDLTNNPTTNDSPSDDHTNNPTTNDSPSDDHTNTPTTTESPSDDLTNTWIEDAERLVEVFSVRINRTKNCDSSENSCADLYGAVRVEHDLCDIGGSYLYNRHLSDSECINLYDGTLHLTGPTHVIDFCDHFEVILDLKDKDGGDLFPEDLLERSFSMYDHRMPHKFDYGKPMSEELTGDFGSATVYYTIFDHAVQAKVKVELVKGDQVYGSIVARYGDFDYPADEQVYYQSVLFYRPRDNYVKVKHWKVIPLPRVVAVPTKSSLVIEADLWSRNQQIHNRDDQIANGTAVFQPQAKGETVKDIKGDNGFARVTVAWSRVK